MDWLIMIFTVGLGVGLLIAVCPPPPLHDVEIEITDSLDNMQSLFSSGEVVKLKAVVKCTVATTNSLFYQWSSPTNAAGTTLQTISVIAAKLGTNWGICMATGVAHHVAAPPCSTLMDTAFVGTGSNSFVAVNVEITRNHSFSNDNDLPTSAAVKNAFGGVVPVIDKVQFAPNTDLGPAEVFPVELQGVIKPSDLHLDLTKFNIHQEFDVTMKTKFDNAPPKKSPTSHFVDHLFGNKDLDRDGDANGNKYYIFDAPGVAPGPVEEKFILDSHITEIIFTFDFTTIGTCNGKDAGVPFKWSITIKAIRKGNKIIWK